MDVDSLWRFVAQFCYCRGLSLNSYSDFTHGGSTLIDHVAAGDGAPPQRLNPVVDRWVSYYSGVFWFFFPSVPIGEVRHSCSCFSCCRCWDFAATTMELCWTWIVFNSSPCVVLIGLSWSNASCRSLSALNVTFEFLNTVHTLHRISTLINKALDIVSNVATGHWRSCSPGKGWTCHVFHWLSAFPSGVTHRGATAFHLLPCKHHAVASCSHDLVIERWVYLSVVHHGVVGLLVTCFFSTHVGVIFGWLFYLFVF